MSKKKSQATLKNQRNAQKLHLRRQQTSLRHIYVNGRLTSHSHGTQKTAYAEELQYQIRDSKSAYAEELHLRTKFDEGGMTMTLDYLQQASLRHIHVNGRLTSCDYKLSTIQKICVMLSNFNYDKWHVNNPRLLTGDITAESTCECRLIYSHGTDKKL